MLAIDTNVIVRYLTGDDPKQSARARKLIETGEIFVPTTVLLETEWVLRSIYDFDARRLADALIAFAGLPGVTLQNPPLTARALEWARQGMDFADALHLAAADGCEAFMSFDEGFLKAATKLGAPARRA
jgi:predicted nucleic acid-binding protein